MYIYIKICIKILRIILDYTEYILYGKSLYFNISYTLI